MKSDTCVLRGGSWSLGPGWLRGAARSGGDPPAGYDSGGFRLAMTEEPKDTESPCVLRGGSWHFGPLGLRGAARSWYTPLYGLDLIGFRLAQD